MVKGEEGGGGGCYSARRAVCVEDGDRGNGRSLRCGGRGPGAVPCLLPSARSAAFARLPPCPPRATEPGPRPASQHGLSPHPPASRHAGLRRRRAPGLAPSGRLLRGHVLIGKSLTVLFCSVGCPRFFVGTFFFGASSSQGSTDACKNAALQSRFPARALTLRRTGAGGWRLLLAWWHALLLLLLSWRTVLVRRTTRRQRHVAKALVFPPSSKRPSSSSASRRRAAGAHACWLHSARTRTRTRTRTRRATRRPADRLCRGCVASATTNYGVDCPFPAAGITARVWCGFAPPQSPFLSGLRRSRAPSRAARRSNSARRCPNGQCESAQFAHMAGRSWRADHDCVCAVPALGTCGEARATKKGS